MEINKTLNSIVNKIPFVMITTSGIFAYISHLGFYKEIYHFLGDIIGYSIITNIVFIKHYHREAFCNPTKASVYGLLLMNVVNLIVLSELIQGRYWYDIVITFAVLGIILIGYLKRW